MTELKLLDDKTLWDSSCMTRVQAATWQDSDYRTHEEGTRNTIKTLLAWHDLATTPRPLSEYHEDMGDVLWWRFPITEAPYVGSPLTLGYGISQARKNKPPRYVGGWPGCHTHFTPIPMPAVPK